MRRYLANLIFSLQLYRFIRAARPRFRRWIELEELKEHFIRAAEEGTEFPLTLFRLLSAALGISPRHLQLIPWQRLLIAFNQVCLKNLPLIRLPLLTESSPIKAKKDAWDYEGRIWYLYSNMIAQSYGWTLDEISQLKVEDALAIIQEILTDEQLQREFAWGLSERAFSYDPKSKQSEFHALPRPYWMRPKIDMKVKKTKIPKMLMPVGMVNYDAVDEATRPKEIPNSQAPFLGGNVGPL